MAEPRTHTFRQRHRLRHDREFQAVYASGVRKQRGVLIVSVLPNALEHPRLGLSVGTRVGPAVVRNRCKRLVREAFRLEQASLARSPTGGYDIVVGIRPLRAEKTDAASPKPAARSRHGAVLPPLPTLRQTLVELIAQADTQWRRRLKRNPSGPLPSPTEPA